MNLLTLRLPSGNPLVDYIQCEQTLFQGVETQSKNKVEADGGDIWWAVWRSSLPPPPQSPNIYNLLLLWWNETCPAARKKKTHCTTKRIPEAIQGKGLASRQNNSRWNSTFQMLELTFSIQLKKKKKIPLNNRFFSSAPQPLLLYASWII